MDVNANDAKTGETKRWKLTNFISIKQLLVLLLAGALLVKCFVHLPDNWQEEVKLGDGRVIVIDRVMLRQRGGPEIAINPSGTRPKEFRLKFTHPDNPKTTIEWRGSKMSNMSNPEIPLILDVEAGNPVIYTRVGIRNVEIMYSKYIYQQGSWQEEELPETFPEKKNNLFTGIRSEMPGYIDLKTKDLHLKEIGYSKTLKKVGPKRVTVAE